MTLAYPLFRHEILEIVERDTPISRAMAARNARLIRAGHALAPPARAGAIRAPVRDRL